jgi:hypothetical protein
MRYAGARSKFLCYFVLSKLREGCPCQSTIPAAIPHTWDFWKCFHCQAVFRRTHVPINPVRCSNRNMLHSCCKCWHEIQH